jgi:thiol:disulfide interchange protein
VATVEGLQRLAGLRRNGCPRAFTTVTTPAALQGQLDEAKAEGQWVLLDYYADWCVSCKVMENRCSATRGHGSPERRAPARLDVTADNAASRELLGRYKIPGPPSLSGSAPMAKNAVPGASPARWMPRPSCNAGPDPGRPLMLT